MYKVYAAKCYGQRRPSALTNTPEFSWRLAGDGKNVTQEAYRIRVCDADHHTVWDSGKVNSDAQHNIPYQGASLVSASDYFWEVESFASDGQIAASGPQAFSTGILDEKLWQAKWIEADIPPCPKDDCMEVWKIMSGQVPERERPEETMNPAHYFRREFTLADQVRTARVFVTAHGVYSLFVNGVEYGQPLAPGYTVYKDYQSYQCYDITDSLRKGVNVIGAVVADGWYRGKMGLLGIGNQYGETTALLLQAMITLENGEQVVLASDEKFTAGTGAFIYADLFVGEGYDAGKEPRGWCEPAVSSPVWKSWKPVLIRDYGYEQLVGTADEPAACVREHRCAGVIRTPRGELVVDAGENVAGYLSIRAEAKKGSRVTFAYAEVLDKDGNFLKNIIGQNKNQTDTYIPDRDGVFEYRPRFTFHGFQYVRVTGVESLAAEDVRVCVLASDLEQTGTFICDNEKINKLMDNVLRSQRGNMLYVPTDCPQREKSGFTGDMQIYAPTAALLMDVEAFLRKWLVNCRFSQYEDGQIPTVVPNMPSGDMMTGDAHTSAGWGDACVIVPYRLYRTYGDEAILRENYEMMRRWMDYVEAQAANGIPAYLEGQELTEQQREDQRYLWNTGFHFGDWLVPSLSRDGVADPMQGAEMTKELVAPAMFAYTTGLMTEIAGLLGDAEGAAHYRTLNQKIKDAYARTYITGPGRLKLDLQGIYVLALQMDLIPREQIPAMADRLAELIAENDGCLDTGFLSMPFLLDVLYNNGKQADAFKLLYQEKCPSWLYEVSQGANTIWESWTNILEDGTRNNSSYNHFAFGCVADFIYRRILGIEMIDAGYSKVRIAPDLSCGLDHVQGSLETIHGRIGVSWRKSGSEAFLDLEIPPNVTALVEFDGKQAEVGSGIYRF